MQQSNRSKYILYLGLGIISILIVYAVFYYAVRAGKTEINVEVVPTDSTITMDGKKIKAGNIYVTPGSHTFEASKDGFSNDKQIVEIGSDYLMVGLIPAPASDEADSWLAAHPEVQTQREGLAGINADRNGLQTRNKNPIIKVLPYYDPKGLYAINYGEDTKRADGIFVLINNSAPEGRQSALRWIERQGFKPAELDIRFGDFENPLTGKIEGMN